MKKSLNFYCLRTFSSVRTFSSGLSKHNTQIMHVPTSNGVASSDEFTRCITGSAAASLASLGIAGGTAGYSVATLRVRHLVY